MTLASLALLSPCPLCYSKEHKRLTSNKMSIDSDTDKGGAITKQTDLGSAVWIMLFQESSVGPNN
eukprot:m.232116 g.232116  ORF g.232116 m.232116 type:complete len:65 (-) comp17074_c0_seq3:7241-7435(-)